LRRACYTKRGLILGIVRKPKDAVLQLQRGCNVGSVPSISHAMVPIALAGLNTQFPDIRMNVGARRRGGEAPI
jgi:hypothetical protein